MLMASDTFGLTSVITYNIPDAHYRILKVSIAPNNAPIIALISGLLVKGHTPEEHLPKYPMANPIAPPITTPKIIFIQISPFIHFPDPGGRIYLGSFYISP